MASSTFEVMKRSPKIAAALKGRNFLKLLDYTSEEIEYLLQFSAELKERRKRLRQEGRQGQALAGKSIALLFEKDSTRTRCSFENSAYDEGAAVTCLTGGHFGKKESVEDSAKVLGRMYDGIEFRGFEQETVELLGAHAGVPVWNGLTDSWHPTQVLADFLTIQEHIDKPLKDIKFVFVGDALNNVSHSLMVGCAKMGMHFVALAPKQRFPDADLMKKLQEMAATTGGKIEAFELEDMDKALTGADVLYTDVWVSMGEEDQYPERLKLLVPYRVDRTMMEKTRNPKAIFLHCLPAYHDTMTKVGAEVKKEYGLGEMEVSDEVFRSANSKVFDQAENRLHTIKAVVVATIGVSPASKL